MTTPAKLYGKDLSEYDDVDVESLLAQLSPEEINILAKEVDPDVMKNNSNNKFIFYKNNSIIFRTISCLQVNGTAMNVKKNLLVHWTAKSLSNT